MIESKVGVVAMTPSAGNIVVSGLGFTPKLVLFQTTPDTADIVSEIANAHYSFGASDGTNQYFVARNSRNGVISQSSAGFYGTDRIMFVADPPGTNTPDYYAAFVSLDSDGFTINVTDPPPINYRFGWMALGGDIIDTVKVGMFQSTVFTGVQAVNIGLQPHLLLVNYTANSNAPPTAQPLSHWGITDGFSQFSMTGYSHTATFPSVSKKIFSNAALMTSCSPGGINYKASFVSFNPTGFSINKIINPFGSSTNCLYVAIKFTDPNFFWVADLTLPASPGTTIINGLPFSPKSGIFFTPFMNTYTDVIQPYHEFSIGFASYNNQFVTHFKDVDNVTPTNTRHGQHSQYIGRHFDSAGNPQEQFALTQWNNDGFEIYSSNAILSPSKVAFVVFGGESVSPPEPGLSDNFGFVV